MGGRISVHGHGGRERLVLGVFTVDGRAQERVVECRRYRCQGCGCVMLVVPRDQGPWRRYTLATIALAMLGAAQGRSATVIRGELSLYATFEEGWASLGHWLREVRTGRLFRWIRGVSELSGRRLAERVSAVIVEASGLDARSASPLDRAWLGAMSLPT